MKRFIIFIILFVVIILGLVITYLFMPTKIPVLTYHDFVKETPQNTMQIKEEDFRKEMKYLHDHHYKSLTLKDIDCFINNQCKLPKKSVLRCYFLIFVFQ